MFVLYQMDRSAELPGCVNLPFSRNFSRQNAHVYNVPTRQVTVLSSTVGTLGVTLKFYLVFSPGAILGS